MKGLFVAAMLSIAPLGQQAVTPYQSPIEPVGRWGWYGGTYWQCKWWERCNLGYGAIGWKCRQCTRKFGRNPCGPWQCLPYRPR